MYWVLVWYWVIDRLGYGVYLEFIVKISVIVILGDVVCFRYIWVGYCLCDDRFLIVYIFVEICSFGKRSYICVFVGNISYFDCNGFWFVVVGGFCMFWWFRGYGFFCCCFCLVCDLCKDLVWCFCVCGYVC